MWNAPLSSGIALSVATGCAFFLFGLAVGLVIAGVCWAFIAASGDRPASSSQESYAFISDDEIDLVIELVREAVAGSSGWSLCGDCYTLKLLQQLPFPVRESGQGSPSSPTGLSHREPDSTLRVDAGRYPAQNTRDSHENGHKQHLRVEQGESVGSVALLSR